MFIFPSQRFFLKGKAKQAIFLALIGSFLGVIFSLVLFPLLFLLFSSLFNFHIFISLAIIFVLGMFIFQEKNNLQKAVVFVIIIFSGVLGIFTLKYNYFTFDTLFVCVFGLFALPMLFSSVYKKPNKVYQENKTSQVSLKKSMQLSFVGSLAALLIILIPSFSSSQASTLVSKFKRLSSTNYLIIFSSITISSLLFSFFLAINFFKPRLGYIAILLNNSVLPNSFNYALFSLVSLFSCALTILIILSMLKGVINFINTVDFRIINLVILILSIFLVIYIAKEKSIPLLILSTAIGSLPLIFDKSRIILMSYIMLPTLLFYI